MGPFQRENSQLGELPDDIFHENISFHNNASWRRIFLSPSCSNRVTWDTRFRHKRAKRILTRWFSALREIETALLHSIVVEWRQRMMDRPVKAYSSSCCYGFPKRSAGSSPFSPWFFKRDLFNRRASFFLLKHDKALDPSLTRTIEYLWLLTGASVDWLD